MKIVIGNYSDATDGRNLILNENVTLDHQTQMLTLVSGIEGLDTAPYRNGTGDWSGADGGYISSQLFSARTITISGTYIDKRAGCDFATENNAPFDHIARLYIRSRLPIRTKQHVRIFLDSNMTFITEGYCVDIKMDYNYVGYGEYQITMYCPDPALYRCDTDGALGSEWRFATLRKENQVGYVHSEKVEDVTKYAMMEQIDGENHGIVWRQGGRSTPVVYAGDFPYQPQFVIEPGDGEHITNPMFLSLNDGKFFGLGYPDSDTAKITVSAVDSNGAITGLAITDPGSYESDFTANGILAKAYSYFNDGTRTEFGAGAMVNLGATKNSTTNMWEFTSVSVKDGGASYQVGDVLVPQIAGATILQLSHGDKCVIDMAEHTAVLNGESVAYYVTPGSEWFTLSTLTSNNIIFQTANEDDADYAQIRWRDGYLGI